MEYVWIVTGKNWEGAVACASSQVAYHYIENLYNDGWKLWGENEYEDEAILTNTLAKLSNAYVFDNDHFYVESRLGTIWADKAPIVTMA